MTPYSSNDSTNSKIRLDKWLWYARFVKSRTSGSKLCLAGKVRINSQRTLKAHSLVRVGDILTFPLGSTVRVVQIVELGQRRGPASEAQHLYQELSDSSANPTFRATVRDKQVRSRPTKKDRRDVERFTNPKH